jgi:hypothetical protein
MGCAARMAGHNARPTPANAGGASQASGTGRIVTSWTTLRAARKWFGYGRWNAPYSFVGMEPGGTVAASSYESWKRLGGGELIDCKQHHLDTNFNRWHGDDQHGTQPTWRRLIQTMLGFEGLDATLEDVLRYQHDGWGYENDDTALIELGALHAPSLASELDLTCTRGFGQTETVSSRA